MPTAAELNVKINSTLDESGFDRAEQRVQGLGSRLGTALGTAGGFLLANAVQAVASNIGQLASEGLNFEAAMANVNSIAQLSSQELQTLSDQVLALANNPAIVQAPSQLAAGLYNIQSSGFEGAAAMDVLTQSALAATAGMTTTDTAAQVIAGNMNAFGQETYTATQIADVLFKVVDSGVITFEELANNMGNTSSLAANLGVGIDQLGAAYAQLTLNNVNASAAETQIAALMRSAINPTTQLTEAVQAYGYETAEALIAAEGLPGFLTLLSEASGGSQTALADLLGTAEAANAALILGADGASAYTATLEEMTAQLEGGGAMQAALNKQMQSASFRIAKMRQQLQVAATMFMGFLAPGISAAAEGITRFISGGLIPFVDVIGTALRGGFEFRDAIDALPEPLQRTAGAVGSIAEAIGDLIRAFQDRGIGGLFDTLFTGGEGQQIVTALTAIADEAFNGLIGAFHAINWGAVWDVAVQAIQGLAAAGIDLGSFIVSAAIDLGGDLLSAAGNLWGWVLGKLFGNDTIASGVAAVTGAAGIGDGVAGSRDISLGDIIVQGALRLGEGLLAAAGNLWGWVEAQLGYGSSGTIGPMPGVRNGTGSFNVRSGDNNIQLGDVLIDGALSLGETLKQWAGNLWGWIDEQLQPSKDTGNPHIVDVVIDGAVTLGVGLAEIAGNLSGWLQRQIMGGTGDPNSGSPGQVANGGGSGIVVEIAQIAIDVLDAIADVTAADIEGWIQREVDTFTTIKTEIEEWGIILGGSPEVESAPGMTDGDGALIPIKDYLEEEFGGQTWYETVKMVLTYEINKETSDDLQAAVQEFIDSYNDITATLNEWIMELPLPSINLGFDEAALIQAIVDKLPFPLNIPFQIGLDVALGGGDGDGDGDSWDGSGVPIGNKHSGAGGELDESAARRAPNMRPVQIPPPDTTEYDRVIGELPTRLARGMASATQTAQAGASLIGSVIGSGMTAMVNTVTGLMGQFTSVISSGMATAQGVTASASGAIVGIIGSAFAQVVGIVASTTGQIPGIIAGNLAAAAGAAYSSGLAIGQGLAAGMNASLGAVRAAADALAAEATRAAQARLQVASPSRVFEEIGQQVGDGFVRGMQSRYGAAGRAGDGLAGASIPNSAAAAYGRRGSSGQTVQIFALKSDELVRLIEKAERGGQFAEQLPQLIRQGAY